MKLRSGENKKKEREKEKLQERRRVRETGYGVRISYAIHNQRHDETHEACIHHVFPSFLRVVKGEGKWQFVRVLIYIHGELDNRISRYCPEVEALEA